MAPPCLVWWDDRSQASPAGRGLVGTEPGGVVRGDPPRPPAGRTVDSGAGQAVWGASADRAAGVGVGDAAAAEAAESGGAEAGSGPAVDRRDVAGRPDRAAQAAAY